MTVRTLLAVLIVLLVANLGVELWNRMDPPEAVPLEDALAPAPFPHDPQYYDDNVAALLSYYDDDVAALLSYYDDDVAALLSYYYGLGALPPADGEFSDAFSAEFPVDSDVAFAPDFYDYAGTPTVARIVDGDTFELSDGTMLRLIGIDTPEVHPSGKLSRDAERTGMDKETIRALGRRASAYAAELALGKRVELEYGSGGRTDRYGRTLAYVWVLDEQGRRLYRVNDRLVADGYANIYSGIPFEYSDEYLEYEREAREEGRGLWGE